MRSLLLAVALLLSLSSPTTATGQNITPYAPPLADRSCTWQLSNGQWPSMVSVRVADATTQRPSGASWTHRTFPAAQTNDRRVYSFLTRMGGAIGAYNGRLPSTGAGQRSNFSLGWSATAYRGSPTANNTIVVYYWNTPNQDTLTASNTVWRWTARGSNQARCAFGASTDTRLTKGLHPNGDVQPLAHCRGEDAVGAVSHAKLKRPLPVPERRGLPECVLA